MTRSQLIAENTKAADEFFQGQTHASTKRIEAIKAEGEISPQLAVVLVEDKQWRTRATAADRQRRTARLTDKADRTTAFEQWKAAERARLTPNPSMRRPYASSAARDALPTPRRTVRSTEDMMRDRKARLTYFKVLETATPERIALIAREAEKPFTVWVLEHTHGPNAYSTAVDKATATEIDRRAARGHLYTKGQIRPAGMTLARALEIAIIAAERIENGETDPDHWTAYISDGL